MEIGGLKTRSKTKSSEALYFIWDYSLRGGGGNVEAPIKAVLSEHKVFCIEASVCEFEGASL